jgi:hypothetical protein
MVGHPQVIRRSSFLTSDHYLLDLVERNLILSPVVELRRAGRLVVGDVLRCFKRSLVLQVRVFFRYAVMPVARKVWFPILVLMPVPRRPCTK